MRTKSVFVLMVEDDVDDQFITEETFNEFGLPVKMLNNSDELISELSDRSRQGELPNLIILDYHSGPANTPDLLSELKRNHRFAHIPVVVISGSNDPTIVKTCYAAGAASFIQKPTGFEATKLTISNFIHYWYGTVELA